MPFVAGDINRNTVFIQPNVWDNEEYAIVINTNNENITKAFSMLIESGEIVKLKSESAYFFHVGTQYVGYGSMILGAAILIVGSGGTATPAILVTAGLIADAASDSGDVADSCYVNNEGDGWCGGTIALAVLPIVPSAPVKNFLKSIGNIDIVKKFGNNLDFINKYFGDLTKKFHPENLGKVAKNEDDILHLAKGKKYIDDVENGIDNFHKDLPDIEKLRLIKKIGKYSDEFLNNGWIRHTGDAPLYRGINGDQISIEEVFKNGFISRGKDSDYLAHIKLGSPLDSRFISTSTEYSIGARFAARGESPTGYIFKINPRARNGINAIDTLESAHIKGDIDEDMWEIIMEEQEISFIDNIDPEDIEGVWPVTMFGRYRGEFIPNTKYVKG